MRQPRGDDAPFFESRNNWTLESRTIPGEEAALTGRESLGEPPGDPTKKPASQAL